MRNRVAVALTLLAGLVFSSAAPAQSEDWVEHIDRYHGFSLRYPAEWTPVRVGVSVAFVVAEPERSGQFRKNIVVENPTVVPVGTTVEQVHNTSDVAASTAFDDYEVVKREPIDVGSVAATVVHYTWVPSPGMRAYQMRLALVVDGRAHFLIGTTLADSPTLETDLILLLSIMTTYRTVPSTESD